MANLVILTGGFAAGKTQAALGEVGNTKAVFFVPSPFNKNPLFRQVPYCFFKDLDASMLVKMQQKYPRVRLVVSDDEIAAGALDHFSAPNQWADYTFVFDDAPTLLYSGRAMSAFRKFLADIRHRSCKVVITTQQVIGVLGTYCRTVADSIVQLGPLVSREEAQNLYRLGASARFETVKAFYSAVSKNPPYQKFPIK